LINSSVQLLACSARLSDLLAHLVLLELAYQAAIALQGGLHEVVDMIYQILIPIYENSKDYKKLSQLHGKLKECFAKISSQVGRQCKLTRAGRSRSESTSLSSCSGIVFNEFCFVGSCDRLHGNAIRATRPLIDSCVLHSASAVASACEKTHCSVEHLLSLRRSCGC